MPSPSRFPSGLNTAARGDLAMWNFLAPDPTKMHVYFNDFDTYLASDWVITTVEAGVGAATEALTDVDGGALLITNDAADDDSDFFQLVGESFLLATGKKSWFKTRFKTSDATQSDIVFGLQIRDTTPLDVTDGIYFLKSDGAATASFICGKDATTGRSTSAAVTTLVTDTFTEWAWYFDGRAGLTAYVNDVPVVSIDPTNYFPDTELTVSFGIQNGEAVAKTLTVDYLLAAKER